MKLKTFIKLFSVGASIHLVFWMVVVSHYAEKGSGLVCGETSCWVLLIADFPAAIFASDGSPVALSRATLIFGTIFWGLMLPLVGFVIMIINNFCKHIHGEK